MTIYISGPISGIANRNKKSFCAAYREIARLKSGLKIINPLRIAARLDKAFSARGAEAAWFDYMRADIKKLCDADALFFLKGWPQSDGATVERYIATRLGIPCADSIDELKKIMEADNAN